MQLHSLIKTTTRSQKRLGRGYGSGKGGHTSSRGAKGQRARNSVAIWFEGGQLPLIKRLPFQRGKGRFKSLKNKPILLNLNSLNSFPKSTPVTLENLVKHKLISQNAAKSGVKILNTGQLKQALSVQVPISAGAARAIKKAGGKVSE